MPSTKKNRSPWLYQLKKDRPVHELDHDVTVDVSIVGAGIAGVSTAFFLLKDTDAKIALVDKYMMGHGATGHNAGQVVSYFERGFASLVDEFGLPLATEGQKAVEDAWVLIQEMYDDAGLAIPFSRFLGHAALSSREQVLLHLKNNLLRREGGLDTEQLLVANEADFAHAIPKKYASLYSLAPHAEILKLLETKEKGYVAALSYPKGCVNSALFCEGVIEYLQKKYPDRFSLYEHTPINKIILRHTLAVLDAGKYTITAGKVVLCTNGFEGLTILNETGLDIDTKFHHLIRGTVGYMSGYFESSSKPPVAISYLAGVDADTDDPYFYLTRRKYEYEKDTATSLLSIGGPEVSLEDSRQYSHDADFPDEMIGLIDSFVTKTYDTNPNNKIDYVFTWHGLMGYTQNGVRLVGPEPKNPVLLYNLGCNGVGILPSVYGGKRISGFVKGVEMGASIFDIPDHSFARSKFRPKIPFWRKVYNSFLKRKNKLQ